MVRHSRFLLGLLLSAGAAALAGHATPAKAFIGPIPGCTYYPCPVSDAQTEGHTTSEIPIDQQKNVQADKKRQCDKAHLQTLGQSGQTGQGQIAAGADLTGGQTMGQVSSSLSGPLQAAAQFYFGDNSQFQNQSLGGGQSAFSQAAESSSTQNIAATIFAIEAMQQVQKDSQTVKQLAQQAQSTQNLRQDIGFATKVKAMLVQEMQLRNALLAQLNLTKSKKVAFSMMADQTTDRSSGDLLNGATPATGGSAATPGNATSATTPGSGAGGSSGPATSPTTGSNLQNSAALPLPMNFVSPATLGNLHAVASTEPLHSLAVENLAESLPADIADRQQTAAALAAAFDGYNGEFPDRLRQISLVISDNPARFGLPAGARQDAILEALRAYAGNIGITR